MSWREWTGIVLFASGVAVCPFGYWVDIRWYLLALVLGVVGLLVGLSGRGSRASASSGPMDTAADLPPGPHELRGFPGARVFNHDADD